MCIAGAQVCFSLGDSRVKVDRSTLIGFFIVMGGFHVYEEQSDSQSISMPSAAKATIPRPAPNGVAMPYH